jgi:hypothetical protein
MSSIDVDHLNYIPLVPYNGSGPTGGDSLTEDFNIWYEVRATAQRFSSLPLFWFLSGKRRGFNMRDEDKIKLRPKKWRSRRREE